MNRETMANAPHPGAFVRTEIIDPQSLTVVEAARMLGISRPALSAFLNGRSDLSVRMALRIEKAFGVGMETLLQMQASHDVARTRSREDEVGVHPQSVRERGIPYGEATLSIDGGLMPRLREEAARRRTTISELVEAGIRRVLAEPRPLDADPDAVEPLPTWRGGQPLVDIDDRDALYRAMEEE